MNILSKINWKIGSTVMLAFAILLTGLYSVRAVTGDRQLGGFAWSDTIGWISFDDSPVIVSTSGNISGLAWSDNIGWVKFGGLSSYPNSTYGTVAKLSGTDLEGWARACAGTANGDCSTMSSRGDGWDGWISLKGSNYGVTLNPSTNNFDESFAWGSDVVGWLDWGLVTLADADDKCLVNGSYKDIGQTWSSTIPITSGPDAGKCQTQGYICSTPPTAETNGSPSAPFVCEETPLDCAPARDGITLLDGESHKFFEKRITSGECTSELITCVEGDYMRADLTTIDTTHIYNKCLSIPTYKEVN